MSDVLANPGTKLLNVHICQNIIGLDKCDCEKLPIYNSPNEVRVDYDMGI